jgi:hypothetical protein
MAKMARLHATEASWLGGSSELSAFRYTLFSIGEEDHGTSNISREE